MIIHVSTPERFGDKISRILFQRDIHTVRTNKHEQNTPSRLYQQNILIDLSWRLSEKQS